MSRTATGSRGAGRVWVVDDTDADFSDDEEECYRGEFRFDGASWWAVEDDQPC